MTLSKKLQLELNGALFLSGRNEVYRVVYKGSRFKVIHEQTGSVERMTQLEIKQRIELLYRSIT